MDKIIEEITDKDDKKAYARTKEIVAASELSSEYYSYLDSFASLLNDKKSYIRTRAFVLCCSQARWDDDDRIGQLLSKLMALFHDTKPTVVRQCLNAAKEIVIFKPELGIKINAELEQINLSYYKDSMANLICNDIDELKRLIEETARNM